MNPSPSTNRHYGDFNGVSLYKAGTYATGTRYLRGRAVLIFILVLVIHVHTSNIQCMQTSSL